MFMENTTNIKNKHSIKDDTEANFNNDNNTLFVNTPNETKKGNANEITMSTYNEMGTKSKHKMNNLADYFLLPPHLLFHLIRRSMFRSSTQKYLEYSDCLRLFL